MFGLLTAALLSAGSASPDALTEPLLVINPNISVGVCSGGDPIAASSTMDERTFTGWLDGTMDSVEAFGGECTGYYHPGAQFCVLVSPPGGYYNLEILDAEGIDTTIAMTGAQIEWPLCDDDSGTRGHRLLSRINRYFESGEYLLYVGSYIRGVSASFTLSVTAHDGTVW